MLVPLRLEAANRALEQLGEARQHGDATRIGELAAAIDRDFGGFAALRSQLNAAAATISGSGWGALVFEPLSGRLVTTQFHDHQSGVLQGSVPLLVVDAWEHAYYLQYENGKKPFFEALWNLWNWPDVAARPPSPAGLRPDTPARHRM